jgi:hypothetical protein
MRLALLLSASLLVVAAVHDPRRPAFSRDQVRGVWLAEAGGKRLDGEAGRAALVRLRALGATHVAFGPEVMMDDFRKPVLRFGADDAALRTTLRAARAAGLATFLLPRIESPAFFTPPAGGGRPPWRGDLAMSTPEEWSVFFAEYRRMIAHYGALAREEGVAWLGIGLEYRDTVRKHPGEWRRVAAEAKRAFGGPITYSANWDDYEEIAWWDAVDAIGVGAYFELLPAPGRADEAAARKGLRPWRERLSAFAKAKGRPILFTEAGFTAYADTAWRPWQWQASETPRAIDPGAQADAWRAMLKTFAGEEWWAGVFVWRFYTDPAAVPAWDYGPEGREAELVLRNAFGG